MAAMGLVLPIAFHAVGLGSKFLPMLLPLLLNGFLVPASLGHCDRRVGAAAFRRHNRDAALVPSGRLQHVARMRGVKRDGCGDLSWPPVTPVVRTDNCDSAGQGDFSWSHLAARKLLHLPATIVTAAALVQGLPGVLLQLAVVPLVVRQTIRRRGLLFNHDSQS